MYTSGDLILCNKIWELRWIDKRPAVRGYKIGGLREVKSLIKDLQAILDKISAKSGGE